MFLNDDITTISERAFYKDEYLSAINMPRKLELIDKYAFYGCDTLTFVRARNCSRLRRIEDHAFYSCTMLAELRLPEGLTSAPVTRSSPSARRPSSATTT